MMLRAALALGLIAMLAAVPAPMKTCAMVIATGSPADYRFTTTSGGVRFDVDGNGVAEQTAWIENVYDVAVLAIDLNENGTIDSGKELIGGQMFSQAPHAISALERLAPLRSTSGNTVARHEPGFLDVSDALWSRLLLWHDLNRNGRSEPEELRPVGDVLKRIGLGYSRWNKTDGRGNLLAWRDWVELKHPPSGERYRDAFDVVLHVEP
jgi:hypothetical protein